MIVTIDGSAGSGKSTAARKLAARLQIAYLDTGAMYRAIAYAAQSRGVDLCDETALLDLARSAMLELDCGPTHTRVRLDGCDVSELIRTMAVSGATPFVARNAAIRELLVKKQQEIGRLHGSFVAEGRDQGSVVFPEADLKFVVEAAIETRARRRLQELLADGENVLIADVIDNLNARDAVDTQQWAPLLSSGEAIVIDTTNLSIPQVVDRMASAIEKRRSGPSKAT